MASADADRLARLSPDLAEPLLNYFVRRVDDPADAADLLGDTYVVLCRRSADLPPSDDEVRLWAFGVARRVLADHRRGRRRRSALVEKLRSELQTSTRHETSSSQATARLNDALDTLDDVDREIVQLVHWDGFTQAAVATILQMPPGTVRSRYTRARDSLRRLLQSDQADVVVRSERTPVKPAPGDAGSGDHTQHGRRRRAQQV